jgi:hypothetical protein
MSPGQRKHFWVVSLVTILSLLVWVAVSIQRGTVGFPLDDGWIHQTYARSLAAGHGWAYSPGEPSAGATAPFWVLLLVPGYWLGASPVCWVLFLGLLLLWSLAWLAYRSWSYLSEHRGWWAAAAGVVIGLEWHLLWAALSGMETLLMTGLVLTVLATLLKIEQGVEQQAGKEAIETQGEQEDLKYHPGLEMDWRWLGLGALIGLGVWVRPEALTLFGPVWFTAVLAPGTLKTRFYRSGWSLLGGLALFVPYLAFNHWLAGTWWPNTFFAKQAEYAVLRDTPLVSRLISQPGPLLAGVVVALLPGFIYEFYQDFRERRWANTAGALWAVGFVALYAIRLPVTYQHGRYMIPVVPVLILWGLAGTARLIGGKNPGRVRWFVGRLYFAIIAAILVLFWWLGVDAFTKDVAVINGEMVATANWLQANTDPEDLIAAHDIGAIGYITQRKIVDLAGLISPDVIPFIRDEEKLTDYLNEKCPVYFVTFPGWYPEMVKGREKIFQTDTAITREFGKENMAVYLWGKCRED